VANAAVAQAAADFSLVKADSSDPVRVGEDFNYTFTLTNNGGGSGGQEIVDEIPASLSVTSVPPECTLVDSTLTCSGSGEIGTGESLQITVPVTALSPGTVTNTATVTVDPSDPDLANNTDTEQTTVLAARTLSVTKNGTGTVTSSPAGIDCGIDCSGVYDDGEFVTLTATAESNSSFDSWGEDCEFAVANTCTVAMNSDKSVVANFIRARFTAPSEASARELISLNASETTGVERLLWDIESDGTYDFYTDPEAPYIALRLPQPGDYPITLTAVSPSGERTSTSHTVSVERPSFNVLSPSRPATMTSSSSPTFASPRLGDLTPLCDPNARAVFGVVEVRGCLQNVLDRSSIPDRERAVADQYFDLNKKLKLFDPCKNGFEILCADYALAQGFEVYVARSTVKVNGMELRPRNGASIVIFPAVGRIVSSDAVLTLRGAGLPAVTVRVGPLNLDVESNVRSLSGTKRSELNLFSFDAKSDLPDISGFPLEGSVDLNFVKDDERRFSDLTLQLRLPDEFETFNGDPPGGDVTLEADNDRGLILSRLFLEVPNALLGGVRLANLSFTYQDGGEPSQGCARKWWKATADVFIIPAGDQSGAGLRLSPPPERNGVAFCAGEFHSAGGEFIFGVPIPPPQIFPGVFLDSVAFNMRLQNPTLFDGGGSVTAAKITRATGGLLVAFATPSDPYVVTAEDGKGTLGGLAGRRLISTSFALGGDVAIKLPEGGDLDLGNAFFLYAYPDYVAAGGQVRVQTLAFTATVGGRAELSTSSGRFNVSASGQLCLVGGLKIEGYGACLGGEAWVSSKGAVACFKIIPNTFEPGVGYVWGSGKPDIYLGFAGDGCKPSRYWETNVQSAQGMARKFALGRSDPLLEPGLLRGEQEPLAFTVRKGQDTKNVRLLGAGGAPAVEVRAPDGETITSVPDEVQFGPRLRVLADEGYDQTFIGVDDAQPGTYVITPLVGSPAITDIAETRPVPDEGIHAKVSGTVHRRVLRYDVGKNPGQHVTFFERGPSTWVELGSASSGKGTIHFTPAPGPEGTREIVYQLEVDGFPAPVRTLDEFKAPPPPRAGKVKRVRVRRKGKGLAVSWKKVPSAVGYGIVVEQKNGVQQVIDVAAKRHKARVSPVPKTQGGTVEVSALGMLGDVGRAKKARFKATRRESTRLLPFSELKHPEKR
jgi:hypothetical protein